jgi:hypothetical protein
MSQLCCSKVYASCTPEKKTKKGAKELKFKNLQSSNVKRQNNVWQ